MSNEIGMVVDLEIYRAAKIFVKKYGADLAPFMARKRADAMLEFGDTEGQRVWTACCAQCRSC